MRNRITFFNAARSLHWSIDCDLSKFRISLFKGFTLLCGRCAEDPVTWGRYADWRVLSVEDIERPGWTLITLSYCEKVRRFLVNGLHGSALPEEEMV